MRFVLLCSVWLLPAAACGSGGVLVSRVIDGDTILLADGTRIRYIGVDSPERVHLEKPVQFMAKEAGDFNRGLVEGRRVRLEYDVQRRDTYGRTLAYVYLDSLFVNAELVRRGYARTLTIPPNAKHADLFLRLQKEARKAERGLWNREAAARWRRRN